MRKWNLFLWLLVGVLFIFFSLFEIEFEQEEPKRETASAVYVFDARGPKATLCYGKNGFNILLSSVFLETKDKAGVVLEDNGWKEEDLKACTENTEMNSFFEVHLIRFGKVSGIDFRLVNKTREEKCFETIEEFGVFLRENPQL